MPLQPLTAAGVATKQADLYALSNNDLLTQANLIRSNFISWLNANFTVSTTQQTYLNSMDARWIAEAASQLGYVIENRLDVTFTAPDPLPPPSISKLSRIDIIIRSDYSQSGGFVTTGSIAFSLTY